MTLAERKELSQRMLDYRAREDISQAEFAIRACVDRSTINRAENWHSVSRITAAKIERVIKEANNGEA